MALYVYAVTEQRYFLNMEICKQFGLFVKVSAQYVLNSKLSEQGGAWINWVE